MSNITHHSFGRPFPPFGAQIAEILSQPNVLNSKVGSSIDGKRGSVWVLTGPTAWAMHDIMRNHLTIVLAEDADPARYWWGFLADHTPIRIWGLENQQTKRLVAALFRDGCDSAIAGDDGFPPPTLYRREQKQCRQA